MYTWPIFLKARQNWAWESWTAAQPMPSYQTLTHTHTHPHILTCKHTHVRTHTNMHRQSSAHAPRDQVVEMDEALMRRWHPREPVVSIAITPAHPGRESTASDSDCKGWGRRYSHTCSPPPPSPTRRPLVITPLVPCWAICLCYHRCPGWTSLPPPLSLPPWVH